MWYHSNKLTHWQDCTIFCIYGGQQPMQPTLYDKYMCVLNLRGQESPLFCFSVLRPWVCDDKEGFEGRL